MDRISRALSNIRQQRLPVLTAIRHANLDEEQLRELLGDFWVPSEKLRETADRIRSSSIDDPSPPDVPEEDALRVLTAESGVDIREITRAIKVLFEGVSDKMAQLRVCEKELKQCEDIIKSYEETIRLFRDGLYRLNMDITINSSDALFIEHINHAFYENLKQRNIIGKLKQYQILRAELVHLQTIAMIVANHARVPRNVVTAGVSRNNTNSEVSEGAAASAASSSLNQLVSGAGSGTTVGFSTRIMDDEDDSPRFGAGSFPNCRICLMNEADNVLVPCGHIACKQCMSNLQSNNRCFFCRTPSTRIVQMYSN
jgi:hypothetical protein